MTVRIVRQGNADAVLHRIARSLRGPKQVQVGLPAGSDPEQVEKLLYNEFGTSRIPERPALRNALRDGKPHYKRFLASEARHLLAGRTTLRRSLDRLGIMATGDIQDSIAALSSPPNAPSTVAQKGSSNPLVDTGAMRQSITHKIEDP